MVNTWTIIGLLAGLITSTGFIPQIVKGIKTKHMTDVSMTMPIVLAFGMSMWLAYGIHKNDIAIIVANIIAVTCLLIIIYLKVKYTTKGE